MLEHHSIACQFSSPSNTLHLDTEPACIIYQMQPAIEPSLVLQIAIMELREKKIPFTVRRYLPDGRCATSSS